MTKKGYGLDPTDFSTFNRVHGGYFGEAPPARSIVRAELVIDARIEIDRIACQAEG